MVRAGVASRVTAAPAVAPEAAPAITLLAGGDVSFGRDVGQRLQERPQLDFFAALHPLLFTADAVFVNLESPLSDQRGETQSPWVPLAFNGPPSGADALARIGVTFVSTANNHAWDYGKRGLFETMANLERVGIGYAGTGRSRQRAYEPWILERGGIRVATIAVTDIWNQGPLSKHAGAEHVAGADRRALVDAVRELEASGRVDAILVSHHGGGEYLDQPLSRTRELLRAAVDAGADLVIGHHSHVVQGVEWHRGAPILYSLGNLMMQMSPGRPAPTGMMARIRIERGSTAAVEVCPLRFDGAVPRMLADAPDPDVVVDAFAARLSRISAPLGGTRLGAPTIDGCVAASPPDQSAARDARASTTPG